MANIRIGHVELTVDPDSLVIADIKKNAIIPAIRGGMPQAIPSGSSAFEIQFSVVFPNERDINTKLRPLIALHNSMPFINVQSDLLASIYIESLFNKEQLAQLQAEQDQYEKTRKEALGVNRGQTGLLLTSTIVDKLFYPEFVYAATRDICLQAVLEVITKTVDKTGRQYIDELIDKDPVYAARQVISEVKRYYKIAIDKYNFLSGKHCPNEAPTVDKLVDQFVKCAVNDIGSYGDGISDTVLDASRKGLTAIEGISLKAAGTDIKDGDSIRLPNREELRIVGIDCYETAHDNLPGQEWYDRSATTYEETHAIQAKNFWDPYDAVTLKKGDEGVYGRTLTEIYANGKNQNAVLAQQGLAFPMSLANAGNAGIKDKPYLEAGKTSSASGTGVWNSAKALPDIYANGFNPKTGVALTTPQGDDNLVLPPNAFRSIKKTSAFEIYKMDAASLAGWAGKTSHNPALANQYPYYELENKFRIANQDDIFTIKLRIVRPASFNEMVNKHFYFMTRHISASSFASFDTLTRSKTTGYAHEFNAMMGPSDFTKFGTEPHDTIYIYAPFSTIPKGRNIIEFNDFGGSDSWSPVVRGIDAVPSQSVHASAVTLAEMKRRLETIETTIGLSSPKGFHDDQQFEKIRSILASYRTEKDRKDEADFQDSFKYTSKAHTEVLAKKFIDNWVPMVFKGLSISTVPNAPEALHATMRFSFFNYMPYAPNFGYIATIEGAFQEGYGVAGLNKQYDIYESDLARTPVVTDWIDKTYLDESANIRERIAPYNALGEKDAPLIFSYTYPILAYLTQKDIENLSYTKTTQNIQLKMYPYSRGNDTNLDNIYNVHVESINYSIANNIQTIPLQASEIPTCQYAGKGNSFASITLSTNNLDSITEIRKVDKLMQEVARSTFHEIFPTKVQVISPVTNIFGNKQFILQSIKIADKQGSPGWFLVTFDMIESGYMDSHNENLDLVALPNVFEASEQEQDDIVDTLMEVLFNRKIQHTAVSTRIWRMLIGPNKFFTEAEDADKIKEIPILLQYTNPDEDDEFLIANRNVPDKIAYTPFFERAYKKSTNVAVGKGHDILAKFDNLDDPSLTDTNRRRYPYKFAIKENCPIFKIINEFNVFSSNEDRVAWNAYMRAMQFAGIIQVSPSSVPSNAKKWFSVDPHGYATIFRIIEKKGSLWVAQGINFISLTQDSLNDLIKKTDLNPNISRKQMGLMGRYRTEGLESLFINDRIAFYNEEDVSFPTGWLVTRVFGSLFRAAQIKQARSRQRFTSGNFLAYCIYELSGLLYKNREDANVQKAVRTMIESALRIDAYKELLSAIFAVTAPDDPIIQELYKKVKLRQTAHADLNLPTYNDVYGQLGHPGVNVLNMLTEAQALYTASLRIGDSILTSESNKLRSVLRLGDESAAFISLIHKNRDDIIRNIKSSINNIDKRVEVLNDELANNKVFTGDKRTRAQKRLDNITAASEALASSLEEFGEIPRINRKNIFTEIENLPTYAQLGVMPPINKFGVRNKEGVARSGNNLVEPGWQYYVPYGVAGKQKPDISIKPSKKVNHNKPVMPVQLFRENYENSRHDAKEIPQHGIFISTKRDANKERSIKVDKITKKQAVKSAETIAEYRKKRQKEVRNLIKEDPDLQNHSIGIKSKEDKDKGQKEVEKIINPKKDKGRNLVDVFNSTYTPDIVRLRQMNKSNRVYDIRKAFPTVQLYFLQENQAVFQNWSKLYNYDSIISVAVMHEKESVSGATVELTNFSGVLTNQPDYRKLKIDPRDVIEGEEVTTTLVSKGKYRLGQKGRVIESGELSETAIGDIVSFRLKPGVRIQIRAGYSSVDDENPIIFTGQVAEVQPGKIIRLVAQGYDYQLMRHLEESWTGAFNAFPTIITDMLHYAEHLGKWEPYQYSANWTTADAHEKSKSKSPDYVTAKGWFRAEEWLGMNDTCNDNLYNLPNHGTSPNLLNPFNLVQGSKWYCNGPILDNIYSMRRYIPGYAIAIKPYDERATLYFGPKDGVYICTSNVTQDMVMYNRLNNIQYNPSESNIIARDTYYYPGRGLPAFDGKPEDNDISGTKTEIKFAYTTREKIARSNDLVYNGATDLSPIDISRCFLRLWRMFARGDLISFKTRYVHTISDDEYGDYPSYLPGGFLEYSDIRNTDEIITVLKNTGVHKVFNDVFYREAAISADMKEIRNSNLVELINVDLKDVDRESEYGQTIFTALDKLQKHKNIWNADYLEALRAFVKLKKPSSGNWIDIPNSEATGVQIISSVDYNDFVQSIQERNLPFSSALINFLSKPENVKIPGGRFNYTAEEIGVNISKVLKVTAGTGFLVSQIFESLISKVSTLPHVEKLVPAGLDFPILYFAFLATDKIEYVGYISLRSLIVGLGRGGIKAKLQETAKKFYAFSFLSEQVGYDDSDPMASQPIYAPRKIALGDDFIKTYLSVLARSATKIRNKNMPTRGEQMSVGIDKSVLRIPPNRKPFRDTHIITDMDIISDDIIASKAHMANSVTLWTPNTGSAAASPESSLGAGDMVRHVVAFSPLLQDDIPVTAFDRNAAESAWFEAKVAQVGHGYLADYLREMYQGNVTTLGKPEVNPYDIVTLEDSVRDLRGNFEVKRVVHLYNNQTGFTTTITPHLISFANEDMESQRVIEQSVAELAWWGVGAIAVLASPGLFTLYGLGFAMIAAGATISATQYASAKARGGTTSSFLGIPFPTISAVGHTSTAFGWAGIDSKGLSRRNPCRIHPMRYKGEPLVAGLDGWEKNDWTNQQADDILKRDFKLGFSNFWLSLRRGTVRFIKRTEETARAIEEAREQITTNL